jgi:plasmid stability protein
MAPLWIHYGDNVAVNLSIKNVPETLAKTLRARAERNHRSLQGELMAILEQAVDAHTAARPARRLSIEEVAAQARKLFPKGTSGSAAFIRAMRDGRYGEEWARTGHHAQPD